MPACPPRGVLVLATLNHGQITLDGNTTTASLESDQLQFAHARTRHRSPPPPRPHPPPPTPTPPPPPAANSLHRHPNPGWAPTPFLDLIEQTHTPPTDPRHNPAVALQKLEWRLLFDQCTRAATGQ